MIYDQMYAEYQRLEKEIILLEAQIKNLPHGTLVCTKNGNYVKWYKREGGELRYLKKDEQKLAEELALKKYLTLQLEDLLHEKTAINRYLKHHHENVGKSSELLSDTSAYHTLLASHFISYSKDLQEWVHMPYNRNKKYPEQLIHKSLSGNTVRSKSEVLIDINLYQNHIPYRYESPLALNAIILYPDFTIRHPKTGKEIYWEHFGMMDNPDYARNACNKLQLYTANGLIPSIDVITTYETKECPLTTEKISLIIKQYFSY